MSPIILSIVLDPDKAAALWADMTWCGRDTGPAYTLQALAQRVVEERAETALEFYRASTGGMERARAGYLAAHGEPAELKPAEDSEL